MLKILNKLFGCIHFKTWISIGKPKVVCCPFHYEKTPSFAYTDKWYHCFGCGKEGNISDLSVDVLQNIDKQEYLRYGRIEKYENKNERYTRRGGKVRFAPEWFTEKEVMEMALEITGRKK